MQDVCQCGTFEVTSSSTEPFRAWLYGTGVAELGARGAGLRGTGSRACPGMDSRTCASARAPFAFGTVWFQSGTCFVEVTAIVFFSSERCF